MFNICSLLCRLHSLLFLFFLLLLLILLFLYCLIFLRFLRCIDHISLIWWSLKFGPTTIFQSFSEGFSTTDLNWFTLITFVTHIFYNYFIINKIGYIIMHSESAISFLRENFGGAGYWIWKKIIFPLLTWQMRIISPFHLDKKRQLKDSFSWWNERWTIIFLLAWSNDWFSQFWFALSNDFSFANLIEILT